MTNNKLSYDKKHIRSHTLCIENYWKGEIRLNIRCIELCWYKKDIHWFAMSREHMLLHLLCSQIRIECIEWLDCSLLLCIANNCLPLCKKHTCDFQFLRSNLGGTPNMFLHLCTQDSRWGYWHTERVSSHWEVNSSGSNLWSAMCRKFHSHRTRTLASPHNRVCTYSLKKLFRSSDLDCRKCRQLHCYIVHKKGSTNCKQCISFHHQ